MDTARPNINNTARRLIARAAVARLIVGVSINDMLADYPWLAMCFDSHGVTLLHVATKYGRPSAVSTLTALGASPDSVTLSGHKAVPPTAPPYIRRAVIRGAAVVTML